MIHFVSDKVPQKISTLHTDTWWQSFTCYCGIELSLYCSNIEKIVLLWFMSCHSNFRSTNRWFVTKKTTNDFIIFMFCRYEIVACLRYVVLYNRSIVEYIIVINRSRKIQCECIKFTRMKRSIFIAYIWRRKVLSNSTPKNLEVTDYRRTWKWAKCVTTVRYLYRICIVFV